MEYRPHRGPQERFLMSNIREVLYGGAAGGGKSDGLLIAAIQEVKNRNSRAIIFRKTYPQLEELIARSQELYPFLGGTYHKQTKTWGFPSGAFVRFRHCAVLKDVQNYQGHSFTFIGWDELTHWAESKLYEYMFSRLRSKDPTIVLRIRATTNPGGPGHGWVMQRFNIDGPGNPQMTYVRRGEYWREFIPARLSDNPSLAADGEYEKTLDALDDRSREILKNGRWDMIDGAAFPEFSHSLHTIEPFAIPDNVEIWRGGDDGYNAPACALWFAKYDRRIYVVGEYYAKNLTAEDFGKGTVVRDAMIPVEDPDTGEIVMNEKEISGIMDSAAWANIRARKQDKGRAEVMNEHGANWKPCKKGPGSRIQGWAQLHSLLRQKLPDGYPGLQIFSNCRNLIKTLPLLPVDEKNVDDVDTEAEDHCADALRYGLQKINRAKITSARLSG
jgi:hypothetical protein